MKPIRNRLGSLIAVLLLLVVLFSPGAAHTDPVPDPVLEWNAIMLDTISGQTPFAQARFAAITQLAVFEAVNSITGDYDPYLGAIAAPASASAEAAAIVAAHGVLKKYFPASGMSLDTARANSLAAIPDGQSEDEGISVGEAAAAAMIANRANDGSELPQFYMPPSADPGEWQTTPGCPPAGGVLLHWRDVKPFGIQRSDQFRSPPPPALRTGKYVMDYDEVKRVGEFNSAERPQDRTDVARYFAIAGPPHVFGQAASQVSVAEGSSVSENARAFALITMAINDALVSSMETKYHYVYWRPITAIRAGGTDDNPRTEPDSDWTPFIDTPCFPSYPSAHAAGSNAARRVAEKFFGRRGHDITLSHPGIPDVTLHYTTFPRITDDIDDARVYGGIHYRFDQEAGARQGWQVASYILRNHLRPVADSDEDNENDND